MIFINKYLIKDLLDIGLWDEDMKTQIIAQNGSVQNIKEIPKELREVYKTVWEVGNKTLIDIA